MSSFVEILILSSMHWGAGYSLPRQPLPAPSSAASPQTRSPLVEESRISFRCMTWQRLGEGVVDVLDLAGPSACREIFRKLSTYLQQIHSR